MSKFPIPDSALAQHTAVLGKTGSGKTTTAKLVIEHVVKDGARVCVLDPIKSDWWGLTSSADGKHEGLPFQILGGPRGHVPLHSSAGKAIGGVVASGALPLSIIDMADFQPGGQQKFFADFAQVLLQKMKGVLYLVIEEAHEFAPKERAGFGAENMAIHYAKRIATAGRSKGVRMLVCTHRVQSLHNAVLGSCETLVALRLTAPADQEPVTKWLKANVPDKAQMAKIAGSLSSLSTGSGWVCSGEAAIFNLVEFPRPWTFDNTKTPDSKDAERQVKTAMVDPDKLKALIGDAVKEAERDDPKALRAEIAKLTRELATASKGGAKPVVDTRAIEAARHEGYAEGARHGLEKGAQIVHDSVLKALHHAKGGRRQLPGHGTMEIPYAPALSLEEQKRTLDQYRRRTEAPAKPSPPPVREKPSHQGNGAGGGKLAKAERLILTALAQYSTGRSKVQVALLTGYASTGGGFNNALGSLRSRGLIDGGADRITITNEGVNELGDFDPLPVGPELLAKWLRQLGKAERSALKALAEAYPEPMTKEQLAAAAGYEPSGGGWNNALGRLRTLELITGPGYEIRASEDLF